MGPDVAGCPGQVHSLRAVPPGNRHRCRMYFSQMRAGDLPSGDPGSTSLDRSDPVPVCGRSLHSQTSVQAKPIGEAGDSDKLTRRRTFSGGRSPRDLPLAHHCRSTHPLLNINMNVNILIVTSRRRSNAELSSPAGDDSAAWKFGVCDMSRRSPRQTRTGRRLRAPR